MTQTIDPVQFDTRLFALYQEHANLEGQLASLYEHKIHPMAGDRKESLGFGRGRRWRLSDEEAAEVVTHLHAAGDQRVPQLGVTPGQVLEREALLSNAARELWDQISALEYVYQQDPWTRWFPCLNADGHVHSTLRGCPTVRPGTQMGWATELSGTPVETAIQMPPAGLGPRLCSVCFPDAPVEHCRSLRDITRAEREAEKAARAEAKFAKSLRDSERFRDYDGTSWVTTVAGCKKALRDEVEFRDYYGKGEHPFHEGAVKAAESARRVLLGRGVPQAEIDTIIERAVIKNRKDGARI
jgi:hypothetical protein